jgi:peptide subunit release factor 1 (eRF1)
MRTKNKMKDFKVEYEEWSEVIKEYFTKDLEKNLAWHRVDEIIMKYKLEIFQKNFSNFVYGNLISTKALDKDEKVEARPNGTIQEEEMKTKEP